MRNQNALVVCAFVVGLTGTFAVAQPEHADTIKTLDRTMTSQAQPDGAPSLSDAGQRAYATLLAAERFEDRFVGYSARPSAFVAAFRTLLGEPHADTAFKSLLRDATTSGQLYALCGLYFTDPASFRAAVAAYGRREDAVEWVSGCIGERVPVSRLVEHHKANTVRLARVDQRIEEWLVVHPEIRKTGWEIDIAGGGYPSTFRWGE